MSASPLIRGPGQFWLKPHKPGPIWRFFASLWLAVGLMLWVGLVCVLGTSAGLQEAEVVFFRSKWFAVILGTLMLNLSVCTLNRSSRPLVNGGRVCLPWRLSQIPFLLVHLGLLLVFSAKIVTTFTLLDAQLHLSEAPPKMRGMPAHVGSLLLKKDRKLEVRALLEDGAKGDLEGLDLTVNLKNGGSAAGRVVSQDSTHLSLAAKGQEPQRISRDDVRSLSAGEAFPVFLNYLSASDDLQARSPRIFWVGLGTSAIFLFLAFLAGRRFSDGSAPIITSVVFGFLGVAMWSEIPTWQRELLGGQLELTYKKYYPHARLEPVVSDDGAPNPALQLRFDERSFWLFHSAQPKELKIEGQDPLVAPVEYGPLRINYERWPDRAAKETLLIEGQKERPRGRITVRGHGPGAASESQFDDVAEGQTFEISGKRVTVLKVYDNFRARALPGETNAGPAATSQPSSQPTRFEAYDDGGLRNPAIEYQVEGESRPRYAFAWFPEFNQMLSRSRAANPDVHVDYHKPKPLGAPSLTFVRYDAGGYALMVIEPGKPAIELDMAPGQSHKVTLTDQGGEPINLEVELVKAFENWKTSQEMRPVTPKEADNWKDYRDAMFVQLSDGQNSAEGWLAFGERLPLTVGATRAMLSYGYQRIELPFKVRLDKFEIEHHPGTTQPREFRSTVTVIDQTEQGKKQEFEADIYMNHTLDHRGYRFFQSSYQIMPGQPKVSIFSVASDPGTPVFYAGCIVLCFGVLVIFFVKPSLVRIEKRRARLAAGLPAEAPPKASAAKELASSGSPKA